MTNSLPTPPSKNKFINRRVHIPILLVLMLPVVLGVRAAVLSRKPSALSSYGPTAENLPVKPSLSAIAAPTGTATSIAAPTGTATAAATSTMKPTATITTAPTAIPETTVRVWGDIVNLRAGPGTSYTKVMVLTFGQQLMLMGRLSDNSWFYVKTSDGQEGWVDATLVDLRGIHADTHPINTPPPTEFPTPDLEVAVEGRWIDIDLSDQMLYAYEGTEVVASFLVSTGVEQYPTELGQNHIDVKLVYSDMRGNDYFLKDVPYVMYYYDDFAIHGTYWHHNFGTRMSRGCVNMDVSDAEWLFNWASVGTLVYIHR